MYIICTCYVNTLHWSSGVDLLYKMWLGEMSLREATLPSAGRFTDHLGFGCTLLYMHALLPRFSDMLSSYPVPENSLLQQHCSKQTSKRSLKRKSETVRYKINGSSGTDQI